MHLAQVDGLVHIVIKLGSDLHLLPGIHFHAVEVRRSIHALCKINLSVAIGAQRAAAALRFRGPGGVCRAYRFAQGVFYYHIIRNEIDQVAAIGQQGLLSRTLQRLTSCLCLLPQSVDRE